ncbi:MAG: O-antigen ligase family protein [Dermatophilaceae bacterium]
MTDFPLSAAVPAGDTGANPWRVPGYVYVLSIGLALQFMSGQASHFGLPMAPDRVLLPLGVILFLVHRDRSSRVWSVRPIHLLLLAAAVFCLSSMIWFGTVQSINARFGFWDSFGVMPFVLFAIAPVVYRSREHRRVLLVSLTILGAYLGLIAALQGLRLESLIFPRYIINAQSEHYGRAFGPSLQVGSNGLQLFACMVCAAILSTQVGGMVARWASRSVVALCAAGLFFTMTRSVWIGGIAGIVAALWLDRRTRKLILAAAVVVPLCLGAVLVLDQSIRDMVLSRMGDSQSAYDRLNADVTALRILPFHPVLGVGYYNFWNVENDWFWQLDTTPVATTRIAVHNVFLGDAVEIGIPGATVWFLGLMGAAKGLLRPLPVGPEKLMWRQAALGYFVCWFAQAMLMPITYPLPSSLLWVFLGIVLLPSDVGFSEPSAELSPELTTRDGGHPTVTTDVATEGSMTEGSKHDVVRAAS